MQPNSIEEAGDTLQRSGEIFRKDVSPTKSIRSQKSRSPDKV